MKKLLRKLLKIKKVPLFLTHRILEIEYGHGISRDKGRSIDKNGMPIPWITYPAIDFLLQFDFKNKLIFEFGCGASTYFWANEGAIVYGVEDDKDWYQEITFNRNFEDRVMLRSNQAYVNSISEVGLKFDIIVVDGRYRDLCTISALNCLNETGILILDNSDRHPILCKQLRDKGFMEIDFHGFGPINNYTWTTSLFFRSINLKPKDIQPVVPKGGGY